MKRRIKILFLSTFIFVGISLFTVGERISVKATDPILKEISNYRDWDKVTREPVKVNLARDVNFNPVKSGEFTIDGESGGG